MLHVVAKELKNLQIPSSHSNNKITRLSSFLVRRIIIEGNFVERSRTIRSYVEQRKGPICFSSAAVAYMLFQLLRAWTLRYVLESLIVQLLLFSGLYWIVLDIVIPKIKSLLRHFHQLFFYHQNFVLDDVLSQWLDVQHGYVASALATSCAIGLAYSPIMTINDRIMLAQSVLGLSQEQAVMLLCQPGGLQQFMLHRWNSYLLGPPPGFDETNVAVVAIGDDGDDNTPQNVAPHPPPVQQMQSNQTNFVSSAVSVEDDETAPPVPEITTTTSASLSSAAAPPSSTADLVKEMTARILGDDADACENDSNFSTTATNSLASTREEDPPDTARGFPKEHDSAPITSSVVLDIPSINSANSATHHHDDKSNEPINDNTEHHEVGAAVVVSLQQQHEGQQQLSASPSSSSPLSIFQSIVTSYIVQLYINPNMPQSHTLELCLSGSVSIVVLQLLCCKQARQLVFGIVHAAALASGMSIATFSLLLLLRHPVPPRVESDRHQSQNQIALVCTSPGSKLPCSSSTYKERLDRYAHKLAQFIVQSVQRSRQRRQLQHSMSSFLHKVMTTPLESTLFGIWKAATTNDSILGIVAYARGNIPPFASYASVLSNITWPVIRVLDRRKRTIATTVLILVLAHWKQKTKQRRRRKFLVHAR